MSEERIPTEFGLAGVHDPAGTEYLTAAYDPATDVDDLSLPAPGPAAPGGWGEWDDTAAPPVVRVGAVWPMDDTVRQYRFLRSPSPDAAGAVQLAVLAAGAADASGEFVHADEVVHADAGFAPGNNWYWLQAVDDAAVASALVGPHLVVVPEEVV